jgi:hypothetical protein
MSLTKVVSFLLISREYIVGITPYHMGGGGGKSNKIPRINSITYLYIKSIFLAF